MGSFRIAIAQIKGSENPNATNIKANSKAIQEQMRAASSSGARLIQFHEGALSGYPSKQLMSSTGHVAIGEADWSKVAWDVLDEELTHITSLAKELNIWVTVGSIHRISSDRRPYNSLYIISDSGEIVDRYDKLLISNSEISYLYTPGQRAKTFVVDGWKFGCAICIEINFPELFMEYEKLGVDCVLFSTYSEDLMFGIEAQGHAASNSYWITFSPPLQGAVAVPAGVVAPNGTWIKHTIKRTPHLVVVDLDPTVPGVEEAIKYRRPWRKVARSGEIYQ
jgi:predicted amidohydrolase